jgi:hypothetical protein
MHKDSAAPKKTKGAPILNRFQLLNMDEDNNSVDEDDELDQNGVSIPMAMPCIGARIAA